MNVIKTPIEGLVIIEPRLFGDDRGYFFESFNQREFEREIGPVTFVQDNESKSCYGVIRGLHFQKGEHAQAKLQGCQQHGAGFDGDDDVQRAQYNRGIITFVSQFCQICQDNFIL